MAPRNGSVVTGATSWANSENIAIHTIANKVDSVKLLPITRYPKYRNGKLINTTKILKEYPDSVAAIKEIPTTPPSIILFGTKNKSRPIV